VSLLSLCMASKGDVVSSLAACNRQPVLLVAGLSCDRFISTYLTIPLRSCTYVLRLLLLCGRFGQVVASLVGM
jgi:hypothetical protein